MIKTKALAATVAAIAITTLSVGDFAVAPAAALPVAKVVTEPNGVVTLAGYRTYRHKHRHTHYHRRHGDTVIVDAPTTRVWNRRGRVEVDAPFTYVRRDRDGVRVRAPFVDLWVPRHR